MIKEFTIKSDSAQPILVVLNNINVNLICPEDGALIVRTDVFREETETTNERPDAKPDTGTRTED